MGVAEGVVAFTIWVEKTFPCRLRAVPTAGCWSHAADSTFTTVHEG